MRKFLLVLMALCLAAVPALAEPAALDFGDFTMTVPAGMQYDMADEIADGELFFVLFQMDDTEDAYLSNLTVSWQENPMDVVGMDPAAFAQSTMDDLVDNMERQSIAVANPAVLSAAMDEIGGRAALSIVYSIDVDFTGIGQDQQVTLTLTQRFVAEEGMGTYAFTLTTDDAENCQPLVDALNSVVWAE